MWFKLDDGWSEHTKVREAAELGGPAAVALWAMVASACGKASSEGVASPLVIRDAAYRACIPRPDVDVAVEALVRSGLWHDPKTLRRCAECKEAVGKLEAGAVYFHDWLEYQFTKDESKIPPVRRRKMRNRALNRDRRLCSAIQDRDGTLCRYCGHRVNFRDRVGDDGGTYDHVDPDGDNTLTNCVVSCRKCNNKKNQATPEEAGMPLFAPGTTAEAIADHSAVIIRGTWPGPGPGQVEAGSGPDPASPDLASRGRDTRPGPGLDGAGSGPGPEQDVTGRAGNGSGQDGPAPGPDPVALLESELGAELIGPRPALNELETTR